MNLITATLFPKSIALPPEIASEREGNIRRHFCAKSARARRSANIDREDTRQYAEQQQNRALIYDCVAAGYDTSPKLTDHTGKNSRTIWAHIHALADDGKIRIDKTEKLWRFVIT